MMISNIRENGEPIGALPDGEMMFHHDMIHADIPSKGTLLYSVEIPSTGGNTLFASGYAAYDTLDPAIRNRLEGRLAMHHYNYGAVVKNDPKAHRRPLPKARTRCSAPTRTPAARRSTSTG